MGTRGIGIRFEKWMVIDGVIDRSVYPGLKPARIEKIPLLEHVGYLVGLKPMSRIVLFPGLKPGATER